MAGGDLVRCAVCKETFTVKLSMDEADQRLQRMGGREGRFRQVDRRDALPATDAALKQTVSKGYCEGIALDWLRRVIQGGRPSYQPSPKDRSEAQITEREHSQTRRGAQAWEQRFGEPKVRFLAEQKEAYEKNLKAVKAEGAAAVQKVEAMLDRARKCYTDTWAAYKEVEDAYNAAPASGQSAIKPRLDEANKAVDAASAEFKRLNDAFGAAQRDANARSSAVITARNKQVGLSVTEQMWPTFTAAMDRIEEGNRKGTGRRATGRPFVGLKILLSIPDTGFDNTATFGNTVVGCPSFAPTTGALIGFDSTKKDDNGHAVAAYRRNTSDYLLFDPNLGMYVVTARGLVDALDLLFTTLYEGYTGEGGVVKAGYTIFGHDSEKTPAVATVGPARPVSAQKEPEPTVLRRVAPAPGPAAAAAASPRPGTGTSSSMGEETPADRLRKAREMFSKK